MLLKLPGVDDMNAALTYKNKDLFLRRADSVLPEGEYFDDELLGLKVYDCDTGALLGTLTAVDEYPASKVYTVKGERELLIPAVKDAFIPVSYTHLAWRQTAPRRWPAIRCRRQSC